LLKNSDLKIKIVVKVGFLEWGKMGKRCVGVFPHCGKHPLFKPFLFSPFS
jgi:hypothetical protein